MKAEDRTYMYEDDLPDDITDAMYDWWYSKSWIDDGVRVGPIIEKDDKMIKQKSKETRMEYLARVLYHFMEKNEIAAGCTIGYDEAKCDGSCLAQDFIDELGIEP